MEFEHKYKSKFTSISRNKRFGLIESKAALKEFEGLNDLFDNKEELLNDQDLILPINFVVGNCNFANLNDDVLLGKVGLKLKDSWAKRPINVEHCRNDVVGYINKSSLCSFKSHKLIDSPGNIYEPFSIAASGYIWKHIGDIAELIEESNKEGSYLFKEISVSWEIAYSEFGILVGSKSVHNGKLILDEEEVDRKKKYLRTFGGDGIDENGNEVYLVISDENAIALGAGIVMEPASGIKGISTFSFSNINNDENKLKKEEKNISQKSQATLKHDRIMKFTNLNEMYEHLSTAGVDVDAIRDVISKELKSTEERLVQDEQKRKSKEDEENLLKATLASLSDEKEKAEKKISELEKELKEKVDSIAALESRIQEIEAKEVLEQRLASLTEKYDLVGEIREAVASSIKGKSDDEYKSWLNSPLSKAALKAFERKPKNEEEEVEAVIEELEKMEVSTASVFNKQMDVQASGPIPVTFTIFKTQD